MYEIEIADSQDVLTVDSDRLRSIVERTLAEEQVADAHVSIALVDNATIRELNRQYLDHDYDTDVLSFLFESEPEIDPEAPVPRGRGRRIEGEIVVSAEMAREMAAEFSWSPEDELVLYTVHGVLHLCGYDDLSDPQRQIMRSRERDMLAIWGLSPHDSDTAGEPTHQNPSSPAEGMPGETT